ncbi:MULTISPECIES: DUF6274 family protein [Streptomyces]|uniref:DUF6274 family protein n=1 Tax=Streptomyces TaxID=1883 RepID=UPI000F74A685|nr:MULTISPECIES: DUF6274 family protein [Streptomyces]MCM3265868.1 DUF6274 family protein [Streptomyces thermoviolaceus]RSR98300.1 hypothetical protein EF917_20815 [Streptomyces sp. WAC00469]WTD48578.1 DUF6274 family protein [Streptomyces thermoviolaceus]
MSASPRHATRALLRAHLAAASSFGHLTPCCPVCRRLLRLAMDGAAPTAGPGAAGGAQSVVPVRARKAPRPL